MKKLIALGLAAALACLATVASAQTRVITLGTRGGPAPSQTRAQPANAVVVRDRLYLVDAGDGVVHQLGAAGLNYRNVDRIFITHNHDDHNAGWGTLMGLQWSTGRRTEVHVHGPAGTESMLQGFLQYFSPNTRIRRADSKGLPAPETIFRAHDIAGSGLVYQDDLITVTALENCHFAPTPERDPRDKSYALKIKTPDKVIVFSGDTGPCPQMVGFARDADILVYEVIDLELIEKTLMRDRPAPVAQSMMRHMRDEHTTAEEVGKVAAAARVKQVILTHVIPGGPEPDDVYVDPVRKVYGGPVYLARDLMSF
jgi:ribonuclease BN (tRNA processing enzyme)